MKRVLSAAIFLPLFWVIVKLRPETYEILIAVAALLALRELFRLASASGQRCHRLLGTLVTLLVMASFAFTRFDIRYALAFALIVLPVASLWRGGEWGPALAVIGITLFIAPFNGLVFGNVIDLRTG